MANLAYNPIEQSVWVGQVGLPGVNHAKLAIWCTRIWLVLLVVSIIKSLQSLKRDCSSPRERFMHLLTLLQNLSDLVNAVQFLPRGFLWSGQLSPLIVGIMGIISSTIGLYKLL